MVHRIHNIFLLSFTPPSVRTWTDDEAVILNTFEEVRLIIQTDSEAAAVDRAAETACVF